MEQLNNEERYGQARNADRAYGSTDKEASPHEYQGWINPSPEELKGPYQGLSSFAADLVVDEIPKTSTEPVLDPGEQMSRLLEMKIDATLRGDQKDADRFQRLIEAHGKRHNLPFNE